MNAVDTKDHLLNLLNDSDPEQRLANIETIVTVLSNTTGLWVDLNYAYKAREIAARARSRVQDLQAACNNWKRHERLAGLRNFLLLLEDVYHEAENEYRYGRAPALTA